jgi:hypothetical protein
MKKYLIALSVGILTTAVFGILAGFGGGACHCATPERVLFPYVALLSGDTDVLAAVVFGLQYPVYAVCVAMPKRADRRMGALLIVLAIHACAVALAFRVTG